MKEELGMDAKAEEELLVKLLGNEGRELLRMRGELEGALGDIQGENPTPQAIARAVSVIGGIFNHLMFCVRLKMAVNHLHSTLEAARPHLSAGEIAEMEQTLEEGRQYLRKNCPAMEPNA